MKANHVLTCLLLGMIGPSTSPCPGDQESELLSILRSEASIPAKCSACYRLRMVGGVDAVPVLATLLNGNRLSHAARHALEGLPHAEAGLALREALDQESVSDREGVIDSLGWRGDPEAVPHLVPFLLNEESGLVAATVTALGRIGGVEAGRALRAFRDKAPAGLRTTVLQAELMCAQRQHRQEQPIEATITYHDLSYNAGPVPDHIRAAAWRGLVSANQGDSAERVTDALSREAGPFYDAAQQWIRDEAPTSHLQAAMEHWSALSSNAQLALFDAHLAKGWQVDQAIETAQASRHVTVRVAAWQAMGDRPQPAVIVPLVRAAAQGQPEEQGAARDSLTRVHGPGVRDMLLEHLEGADPLQQAVILTALGERGDHAAASILVRHANAANEVVQNAALGALRQLALPETLSPLLQLALQAERVSQRRQIMRALTSVAKAHPDKSRVEQALIEAFDRMPAAGRAGMLPLLAWVGSSSSLEPVLSCLYDPDAQLVKDALRTLGQWPTAAPAVELLKLAHGGADATLKILALRACIQVVGKEPDTAVRLRVLKETLSAAKRDEEKKQALAQIGLIPTLAALEVAVAKVENPDLCDEASLATMSIAEELADAYPNRVKSAAAQVLANCKREDIVKRAAQVLRGPGTP